MRQVGRNVWLLIIGLTLGAARVAGAQVVYGGFGVGPTFVLEEGSGNRNWFGMAGYQGSGAFGARLSGAETVSRLWLAAEVTFQPYASARRLRPYGMLGAGLVMDLNDADGLLTAGAGLRAQLERLLFVFAEVRLQGIPGSPEAGPSTILPITFGLGVGR